MPKKLAHLTIKGKNVSLELCTYPVKKRFTIFFIFGK